MALTVAEMRTTLRQSVLRQSDFDAGIMDRAFRAAAREFISATQCVQDTTDVTLGSGASILNLGTTISNFTRHDFIRAQVGTKTGIGTPLRLVPYESLVRYWRGGSPTAGKPSLIAFRDDDAAVFEKPTDQSYTLGVTHVGDLTAWTMGDTASGTLATVINMPQGWVDAIIQHGAKYYLLAGAKHSHFDVDRAGQLWQLDLQRARLHFGDVRHGTQERTVVPSLASDRRDEQAA